jgi:hypothetical protein
MVTTTIAHGDSAMMRRGFHAVHHRHQQVHQDQVGV